MLFSWGISIAIFCPVQVKTYWRNNNYWRILLNFLATLQYLARFYLTELPLPLGWHLSQLLNFRFLLVDLPVNFVLGASRVALNYTLMYTVIHIGHCLLNAPICLCCFKNLFWSMFEHTTCGSYRDALITFQYVVEKFPIDFISRIFFHLNFGEMANTKAYQIAI